MKKDIDVETEMETLMDIRDKKVYNLIKIGNQTWMAENFTYEPADGF